MFEEWIEEKDLEDNGPRKRYRKCVILKRAKLKDTSLKRQILKYIGMLLSQTDQ